MTASTSDWSGEAESAERARVARRLHRLRDAEFTRRTRASVRPTPSGDWVVKIDSRTVGRFPTEAEARRSAKSASEGS